MLNNMQKLKRALDGLRSEGYNVPDEYIFQGDIGDLINTDTICMHKDQVLLLKKGLRRNIEILCFKNINRAVVMDAMLASKMQVYTQRPLMTTANWKEFNEVFNGVFF